MTLLMPSEMLKTGEDLVADVAFYVLDLEIIIITRILGRQERCGGFCNPWFCTRIILRHGGHENEPPMALIPQTVSDEHSRQYMAIYGGRVGLEPETHSKKLGKRESWGKEAIGFCGVLRMW